MRRTIIFLCALCLIFSFISCAAGQDSAPTLPDGQSAQSLSPSQTVPTETSPEKRVGVMGVTFETTNVHIKEGESAALAAKVLPENATEQTILYSVSDGTVIGYENGVITGLRPGQATLKAETLEDGYIARCLITVEASAPVTDPPSIPPTSPDPSAPVSPAVSADPSPVSVSPVEPTYTKIENAPVIVIDAGHGFENSRKVIDVGSGEGSVYYELSEEKTGTGLYEADLNLQIALRVKRLLEAHGCTVIMTRTDYVREHLSITARAERIRNTGAGLLVSIHANAAANLEAHGARIFYNASNDFPHQAESLVLAQKIMGQIALTCPESFFTDFISDGQSLAVLNGSGMTGVLVETAFLTNEGDAKLALDENWQQKMAAAITNGIIASITDSQ